MSHDLDVVLDRMLRDAKAGGLGPLADYLERFPGEDRRVAWAYLEAGASGVINEGSGGKLKIGHYQVIRELGRGGQGVVYLAQDLRLERRVALKVLAQVGPGSDVAIERFRKEALVASRLNHPRICGVFDAGVADGLPYIAMLYVEGMTLAQRLAAFRSGTAEEPSSLIINFSETTLVDPRNGDPPTRHDPPSTTDAREIPTLLRFFEQASRALHAAHEAGVIHRDIKPGNLMITRSGEPMILDFGLAHAEDSGAPAMTRTGDVFGTPAYMAPEQISGNAGRVDRRADVYALGVSLFEALTLQRPFQAPTREGLYQAILTAAPPDPRTRNPAISRDLKVVIETALEKDRDRRYATAEDLADDLLAILERRPIEAREIGPVGRLVRWAWREPWKAGLLAVLLVSFPLVAVLVTARVKDAPRLEAARQLETARRLDELLAEAGYEVSEGRKERGIEIYEEVLKEDARSAEAIGGLVLAHQNLRNLDVAERLLEEHRELIGEGSARHLLMAQLSNLRGRLDEARKLIDSSPPPRTAFEHYVVALRDLGDGEKGEPEAFRRALHHVNAAILMSSSPSLFLTTLRAHIAGHLRDANAVIESVAALQFRWPKVGEAQYWAAYALSSLGAPSLEAAEAAALESARLRPEVARSHVLLAQILGLRDRVDDALAAWREAIRIEPGRVAIMTDYGLTLEAKGRMDDAIRVYQEVLRLYPKAAETGFQLGLAWWEKGDNARALEAFRDAVQADPSYVDARANYGRALEDAGNLDEAEAEYREAIRQRPNFAELHNNFGQLARKRGQLDVAKREYEEAIRLKPDLFEPRQNLAEICAMLGETGAAIRSYREAIRLQSDRPWLHAAFATHLIGFGFEAEAESVLREALRVEPNDAASLTNLGKLLQVGHRYREAKSVLARAAEVPDVPPQAANQASVWLAETSELLEREERLQERLARHLADGTEPEAAAQRATLARIAFLGGKPVLAAEWFRIAFEEDPALGDALGSGHRCFAIRAAALAATSSNDGDPSDPAAFRVKWRAQGLIWLEAEWLRFRTLHEAGRLNDRVARRILSELMLSQDLAPLRDAAPLASLPQEEHARWSEVWSEIALKLDSLAR